MSQRSAYYLKGVRRTAAAFAVIAAAVFLVQILRLFTERTIIELALIVIMTLSCFAAAAGCAGVRRCGRGFPAAFTASLTAAAAMTICVPVALREAGNGADVAMSVYVMFLKYTALIMMLVIYAKVLTGLDRMCRSARLSKKKSALCRVWKPSVVLIVLSLFAVQAAKMFPDMIRYTVTGAAALTALICHMLMIRGMMTASRALDGRRRAGSGQPALPADSAG